MWLPALLLAVATPLLAAVGDVLTTYTVEGVEMKFQVTNEATKTCKVGEYSYLAISEYTYGVVTIPSTVEGYKVTAIGECAFITCSGLTKVVIPSAVATIGPGAFYGCTDLESLELPSSLTSIDDDAFSDCYSLTTLFIPKNVTLIASNAFANCEGLTSVVVASGNTKYDSRDNCNAIIETNSNRLISGCVNTIIPHSVTAIGDYAFSGCALLTSVNLPNSLTTIGRRAFDRTGLTTVNIPNSVMTIGEEAFHWCDKLTSVNLPSSLTTIGDGAFASTGLMSVVIPSSVVSIGTNPFSYCPNLARLSVEDGNTVYESRNDCIVETRSKKLIAGCRNSYISDDIVSIGDYAFQGSKGLTWIRIYNSVTSIGRGAFYGCSGITYIDCLLKKPFGASSVFDDATLQNAQLSVPFNTAQLYRAAYGWKDFVNIYETVPDEGTVFTAQTEEGVDVTYKVTKSLYEDYFAECTVGDGERPAVSDLSVQHLTIPAVPRGVCSGLEVKGIAKGAFSGCSSLHGLSLPETITTLDAESLQGCDNLLALQWNAATVLPSEALANVDTTNPNFLLYVKDKTYAPGSINNVVENGTAENIILAEKDGGNSFYCPWPFTAKSIELTHHYGMTSGYQTCQGWETLALPFDVTAIFTDTQTELVPIKTWQVGGIQRPFWLYEQTANGWQAATAIKANTPYIICMPNNEEHYDQEYNIYGDVKFVGSNVQVKTSNDLVTSQYGQRLFLPNFQYKEADYAILALNVNNQWDKYDSATYLQGSTFIRDLRAIHPFEAYMTFDGSANAPAYIPLFDDDVHTGIHDLPHNTGRSQSANTIYSLSGQRLSSFRKGINIVHGQKVVVN